MKNKTESTFCGSPLGHCSSYVPRAPQQKTLRGPIKSAKRPTIGQRPTVCRPLT